MNDEEFGKSVIRSSTPSDRGISFEEIRRILPQGPPFLFVDKVLAVEEGKSIRCLKNLAGNEPFFSGHFRNLAIMPGVLLLECMAQASILLFCMSQGSGLSSEKLPLLGSVKARFLHPAVPGDQLIIEAVIEKAVAQGAIVRSTITCGPHTIATANLVFGLADRTVLLTHGASPP